MKKLFIIACCLVLILTTAKAQRATLCVTNPSDHQREEVVETELVTIRTLLHIGDNEQLVVRNSAGQEQTYQYSHDGKLLVYVTVQPHSTAELTIEKGKPSVFKSFVFGKVYPERMDDLTWENDCSAYRIYGPALERSG